MADMCPQTSGEGHARPISPGDPRLADLAVQDCGEPLVDLRTVPAIQLADGHPHVRLSLADRLVTAQTLLPRELRLLVIAGCHPDGPDRDRAESHAAGAAVDLTLRTRTKAQPYPETDDDHEILRTVLTTTGFVNHPTAYWHWSYGDRYWAFATGAPAARYGPAAVIRHRH